ncbi:NADPH-dependent oxidoreductase [Niallia taxi]|uniref:NADPH-dependent oxidoreductase n=1 Tax=Niallia taxi TaxID=2499688 RepID=UPI0015F595B1|nr:NADPH-dependent oxidoreductase [Niallia taxi]
MNEVIKTLTQHRSYRKYENKRVPNEMLHAILDSAQAAPSWINGQHVTVIVVEDPIRKEKLAELCGNQKHINEAPVFLVFCMDFHRTELSANLENSTFGAADQSDLLLVGATDAGIALANAITAAESLGLGTVPIGGIRRNAPEVIEFLQLPKYVVPISGLCIGFPAEDPGVKPRLPKEAYVHNETYHNDQTDALKEYNEVFKKYLQERGSEQANWTNRVANFYKQPYYPSIGPVLQKQGFHAKDLKE